LLLESHMADKRDDAARSMAVAVADGRSDEEHLWPALHPSEPLRCLVLDRSGCNGQITPVAGGGDAAAGESGGGKSHGPVRGILPEDHSQRNYAEPLELERNEASEDRVNNLVGKACERLWREQANQPPPSCTENLADGAGATGTDLNVEDVLNCSVDGYISQYFKHVAELSRESVYQAHQREILRRMRTDLIAGERSGNLKEIEEMIQKVEVEDRYLQAEITNLMRIAGSSGSQSSRCPIELGACVCPADREYPPLRNAPADGYATSVRASTGRDTHGMTSPSAATKFACRNERNGDEESAGKGVPACRPCQMQ
jgi:hypothetical protein